MYINVSSLHVVCVHDSLHLCMYCIFDMTCTDMLVHVL